LKINWKVLLIIPAAAAGGILVMQYIRKRYGPACPYWLSGLLENPLVDAIAGAQKLLDILEVEPGMSFLDVGSGPGRITIPAAERVGSVGQVTALDIQPEMLVMVKERAEKHGLQNIRLLQGGAGMGLLAENQFDRAVLVTVLGETPDRLAVMSEIHHALKPGGRLAVAEYLPDPDFQPQGGVRKLALQAGFHEVGLSGKPWGYILILEK
jgi:ubiquinone/menaquinone biosynthesis C-methylase UbiE